MHYLAIPPVAFAKITEGLGEHGLAEGARVVYEKPFGTSPANFRELDETVHKVLDEQQVFRIDHFLGKEGTQDLHALRFGNGLFDHIWNREHVRAVQIDVPETLDIADRAGFYDETGALLDMVVTHLFQLAAEVAMEPPPSMSADDLQSARETVIAAFRPLDADDVVLGQFEGYRDTEGVADDSTHGHVRRRRLWIDTDRWRGVPFLLRTGKQLAASDAAGQPDLPRARGRAAAPEAAGAGQRADRLAVRLRRDRPARGGQGARAGLRADAAASRRCRWSDAPDADPLPPYVRLIHDVIVGDRSLFTRPDGLGHAWDAITPVLEQPARGPARTPAGRGGRRRPRPWLPPTAGWLLSRSWCCREGRAAGTAARVG